MSQFLEDLEPIAREAGALLMSYFDRQIKIEYKGDADLVTAADRASEKLIVERLQARWPEHGIVGEEGTRTETGADYRWFVDPLDGTTNFAQTARLAESILGTGFPSHKRHQNPNIHFYHQLTLRSHGLRRAGSAALDLANVAAGRYDGFWEFNLNPWDTAAGALIVQEAGGLVTRCDGTPFRLDSREVLATNGLIHEEVLTNFREIFAGRGLEPLPSAVEYAKTRP